MRFIIFVIIIEIITTNLIYAQVYVSNEDTRSTMVTAGVVLGLAYSVRSSDFEPLTETSINGLMNKQLLQINQFAVNNFNDDLALVSDVLLALSISISALQVFDGRVKDEWTTYGMMLLETGAISGGLTTIAKGIVRDARPYVYSPDAPLEFKQTIDARQSFFSGHACLSFAAMTLFAETYSNYYPDNSNHNLIWLGAMSLASTTSILRVLSGRHFPIDILVGAAIGFTAGKLIPHIHENSNQNKIPDFRINRVLNVSLKF